MLKNVSEKTALQNLIFVLLATFICSILLYCLLELVNIEYKSKGRFGVDNNVSHVLVLSIFYIPPGFFLAGFLIRNSGFTYHILFYSFSSLFIWFVVHLMVAFGPQFGSMISYADWISIFFSWQLADYLMSLGMKDRED